MIGSGKRHPERGTPFAVPKTLPKSADARTQPTVLAVDESSAGNNLQEDCADAPDTAPKKELVSVQDAEQSGAVKSPIKKRSASCRDENGEDDEDGEECAAATKMRRGEDSEEGQTRMVTGGCHDPKPADAPTPTTVPAADESSTGNNLQGDCADAPDPAPRKQLVGVENAKHVGAMKPPTKKRVASCRGDDCEDDEDGGECAAATKMRRGEDSEEGQTRIVTGGCYDPRCDPHRNEEVYTRKEGWVFRRRLERL